MTAQNTKEDSKGFHLPPGRIRVIMKSSGDPDVKVIQTEAIYVVTRATEMFIQYLTRGSFKMFPEKPLLDYHALSHFADNDVKLEILQQILPKKITMKEYRDMKANQIITDTDEEVDTEDEENDDDENGGIDDNKNTSTENEDSNSSNESSSSSEDGDDNGEEVVEKEANGTDEDVEGEEEPEEDDDDDDDDDDDVDEPNVRITKKKIPEKTDKNKKR